MIKFEFVLPYLLIRFGVTPERCSFVILIVENVLSNVSKLFYFSIVKKPNFSKIKEILLKGKY